MDQTTERRCVLVCEDEMLIAMLLEGRLERAGYRVLMAPRVNKGLQLLDAEDVDVAVLDINMAGEDSFAVASRLRDQHIPFVFCSAYTEQRLPDQWRSEELLRKPYAATTLTNALATKLAH